MNNLLIVRGAPGVGKTVVGKMLSTHYKNGVTIEIDEVRRMINSVTWTSTKEHLDAIEASRNLVISYSKSDYDPVILVDTLSMGTIKMILNKLPEGVNYKVVTLIAREEIIKSRIMDRQDGFMDYQLSFKVNASLKNERLDNNYIIDTSDISVTTVFDKIMEVVQL